MVNAFQLMAHSGNPGGTETALRKGCAVGCAAEQRHPAAPAGHAGGFGCLQESIAQAFVRTDRGVQVLSVDHQPAGIINGVIADNGGRHILVILPVRPAPGFRAAEAGFLGTGQDYADFCMLRPDSMLFHFPEQADTHHAAGEVIIGPVHNAPGIVGDTQQQEKRNKYQSPQSGSPDPVPRAAQRAGGQEKIEEDTGGCHESRDFKDDSAKSVIQGEFPGGVYMPVQEDPLPDLPAARADGGDIGPCPAGEQAVDHRPVHHKMEQEQKQAHASEQDAEPGTDKEENRAERITDC